MLQLISGRKLTLSRYKYINIFLTVRWRTKYISHCQGENEEMKREISEIEAKRVEQHQEMTDDQVFNDDIDDVNYHEC